ncbi:MAG: Grx4 family monothiol glutaredoxin [Rickettsiaceae bacterium]|nr:Grx4 family monothiol glutaredoxin [Rickettsiaceae bacterium]
MSENIIQEIDSLVKNNKVILFMKGSAKMPQCGFSAAVVYILNQLEVPFIDVNVLENMEIREGIKIYADWPTIPQLYINGDFIGGCDIVREMFTKGELQELLKTIKS